MKRTGFIITGIFILCLAILASAAYGQSEKDFSVTVGDGLASAPGHEERALRRIDTPIRLKIIEIKDIMGVMTMSDVLFIVALFIGSILGTYFIFHFIKTRMNRIKPKSIYGIAMEKLAALDSKKANNAGELKDLYYKISRIIRDYSKEVLSFGPGELTTKEFLAKLECSTVIPADTKNTVKELIVHCDVVKFSGNIANTEEVRSHFDIAKNIIEQINTALAPKENNK